jgi:hypothetical protein
MVDLASTFSTVTRLGAGQPSICIPILVMVKACFCSPKFRTVCGARLAFISNDNRSFSCLSLQRISLVLYSVRLCLDTLAMDGPRELNRWQMPMIPLIWYDIFVNSNCDDTWFQAYNTHLHTDNTQNNTMKKNTQDRTYVTIRIHMLYLYKFIPTTIYLLWQNHNQQTWKDMIKETNKWVANFILSIYILITLDTLFLTPSLHFTTPVDTSRLPI